MDFPWNSYVRPSRLSRDRVASRSVFISRRLQPYRESRSSCLSSAFDPIPSPTRKSSLSQVILALQASELIQLNLYHLLYSDCS